MMPTVEDGRGWKRREAAFLVLIAALLGTQLSDLPVRLIAAWRPDGAVPSWALAATAIAVALAALGLWGVYRSLITGSIRQPGLLVFTLAAMFVFGANGWRVEVSFLPVTVVFSASGAPAEAGVNVAGILLFAWYIRLRSTAVDPVLG
jgi:hypothetical protein